MSNNQIILQTVMEHRIRWLIDWLAMRDYKIDRERMSFLTIVYSSCKAYLDDEDAKEETQRINSLLSLPFSDEKMQRHIFSKLDNKEQVLRFTNQKIKEMLRITDEEYDLLNPDKNKKRLQAIKERSIQRDLRNQQILVLHNGGFSAKDIGGILRVPVRTVRRIIQKENENQAAQSAFLSAPKRPNIPILRGTEEHSGFSKADVNIGRSFLCRYKEETEAFGESQLKPSDILAHSNENILLTGGAGTGKSTIIKQYLESLTKEERKKVLVAAPTWKAATNIDGITIHKAFHLQLSVQNTESITEIPEALKGKTTIIIDEISMVRVDVFNRVVQTIQYIEKITGSKIRLILVGDFGQLEPVCTKQDWSVIKEYYPTVKEPYCFNSPLWDSLHLKRVPLFTIYRQEDKMLSKHLTELKYGCEESIDWFNQSCRYNLPFYNAITIVPTNDLVEQYNKIQIEESHLRHIIQPYKAISNGTLTADLPAPEILMLAVGCRVMTLHNSKNYKNGQLGTITRITDKTIDVRFDDKPDASVSVPRVRFTLDNGTIYKQFPVCLAYAITVNKAQGCTFDAVRIDRGNGFWMPGQLYVALSRCKTLRGISLVKKLEYEDLHFSKAALEMTL